MGEILANSINSSKVLLIELALWALEVLRDAVRMRRLWNYACASAETPCQSNLGGRTIVLVPYVDDILVLQKLRRAALGLTIIGRV